MTTEPTFNRSRLYERAWPVRHLDLAEVGQHSSISASKSSTWALGLPLAIAFIVWITALFAVGEQRLISRWIMVLGAIASPALAAASALPIALWRERRSHARHAEELRYAQRLREEADLRLLVLQAQLEPHFLFNTLASLRALLREDVDRAEALVDALVTHLRAVVPRMRSGCSTATLSDQLAICVSYLDLMSMRFEGRFSYAIDVPESLRDAAIPPLTLITLIENAIKHGIERKPGAGSVHVSARRQLHAWGECICLNVVDDGAGLSANSHSGLGLQNICEQLRVKYGELASLSLTARSTGGMCAMLTIPYEPLRP